MYQGWHSFDQIETSGLAFSLSATTPNFTRIVTQTLQTGRVRLRWCTIYRMTTPQILISGILILAMVMFGWGKYRYDLVAMSALLLCVVLGLVDSEAAFAGFGNAAVITVAAVLIISTALKNAGVVDMLASRISHLTETPIMHIAALTSVVTIASAFMNNVGALALMLPIALSTAAERNRSPALLLMPLAFGSLLGGMTTLIGTPPNIIVASIRESYLGEPFSMFSYSPVGLPVALVGFVFVIFVGWRLIPSERMKQNSTEKLFEVADYLTEVQVGDESSAVGKALDELVEQDDGNIEIIGVAGKRRFVQIGRASYKVKAGDILVLRADPADLKSFLDTNDFELQSSATSKFVEPNPDNDILIEGVVKNGSVLENRGVDRLRQVSSRTVALVGLARQGHSVTQRLRQVIFKPGDVLLLRGDAETIDSNMNVLGLWPLAKRELDLQRDKRVYTALAIFAFAIALGIFKFVSMPVAFLLAVGTYLLTGILSVREIYEDIDWPIIVLLAAMIPIGNALTDTGTTALVANLIRSATEGWQGWQIVMLVLVATMLLSDVINNAATALVMAPLGIELAEKLSVNPDPFLMAVAVGASCAFLTPIGHQCNTLVMGPGGYKFGDYWRVGLPLEIVITLVAVPIILIFFPL